MLAETPLTFFSIQTHILKQKGGRGMGYMQAKKSGINIPSKYRRSIHRDVMSRCSLFLLSPVLAVTAGSRDRHCTPPYTLAGMEEINSKLWSQTFSTSFLFAALTLPSVALTGTWELKVTFQVAVVKILGL